MYITPLTDSTPETEGTTVFSGLDMSPTAPLGRFTIAENLCADVYPMLTVRPPRALYPKHDGMGNASGGIVIEDILCTVDGPALWVGDERIDMALSTGRKCLIPYSYYLLIWPDRVYINVLDTADRGSLIAREELYGKAQIDVEVVDCYGETVTYFSQNEPTATPGVDIRYGTLWMKPKVRDPFSREESPPALYRQINTAPDIEGIVWEEVESFIRFSRSQESYGDGGDHEAVSVGEYIVLRGFREDILYTQATARDCAAINGPKTVISVKKSTYDGVEELTSFTIRGILPDNATLHFEDEGITVERAVPEVDCAVAYEGRLFGAYRGISSISGENVNEIYISAAGDFKRFYRVEDTTADPLVMSVSEPGAYRGAAVIGGVVTFFKDRKILMVGGSTPESFYISAYDGRGPSSGCEGTLCVLDGYAYYLADGRVMAYAGGVAASVSDALGLHLMGVRHAIAGAYGCKYYLCAVRPDGTPTMPVFDTARRLWHTEGVPGGGILSFASRAEGLYIFDETGTIWTVGDHEALGGSQTGLSGTESTVRWLWESGMVGLKTPQKKYITCVEVRILVEEGSSAELWIRYDSAPAWKLVWRVDAGRCRTLRSRIPPHRCDHLHIRMTGHGPMTLLGLFLSMETEER